MKTISIGFVDFWDGFDPSDNFITRALDGKIDYVIKDDQEVDFVFCSIFGCDFLNYSCPRIFFTGENCIPDFNLYDYGIGFEQMSVSDRYFRYPLYAACYENDCIAMKQPMKEDAEAYLNREFCSFVVSNSDYADVYREELFRQLSEYRPVSSGGRYLNNIGMPDGVEDKQAFISKYKFNIACENVSHKGYCTEKIVQAFAAHTIPIYWGDPCVSEYFNPKAFIDCNAFASMKDAIEYVKKIDNDDEAYLDMLNQPKIINEKYYTDNLSKEFEKWLLSVVTQDMRQAYRRSLKGWAGAHENKLAERESIYRKNANKHHYSISAIVNRIRSI